MQMTLLAPVEITPRLEAGVRLCTQDGTAWIQVHAIQYDGRRSTFKWSIDGGDGKPVGEGDDLSVYGPPTKFETVHDALTTLLVFLELCSTEPSAPFTPQVQEFAKVNNDEIQFLLHEMEGQSEPKI